MLPCNDTTVPKWDESRPRELPQYFKELEYLFADCSITDDTQKKEYALQYVSYNTAETWLGLPEFVLRLYPGADASTHYNLGDLEQLVNQTFNSSLATLGRFSDYYRDFQCIARWLLTNSKLYHNEECCLFQQGIPMSLWSKIIRHLEITLPDHHPEDPYDVDQVFEGAKWVLKGMDTSTTKISNGISGIPLSLPIANAPATPLPMLNEIGHTMVRGTCMKLEQMIQQGKVHQNAEGKIILPSGAMIPNYFGKRLYMECIEEWHRLNPGQIVTGRLSSNANPDPEQAAMQQLLIYEVMQQDVAMGQVLCKEEWIEALEHELFALSDASVTSSSSNLTPAPATKPTDKGKASEHTVANEPPPIAKEPIAQPPIHPFSGIPGTSANMVQDPSNIFEDILPTFAIEEPQFPLGSNINTANGLTSDKAPFASVDPVEAYINLLPHGEEPVVLTVTKDSQSLHTIMILIDNKEEVECIHDSGSQIISMSVEIASDLGLSYNPNIVLNMQSANSTMCHDPSPGPPHIVQQPPNSPKPPTLR
ncbi:hypothetical protein J132_09915 [Termitomyces sp. J132]|nr:hypothetical protein J132_09915 [Termitomyces sp. J132]